MARQHPRRRGLRRPRPGAMLFATLAAASLVAVPVAASANPVILSVPLSTAADDTEAAIYPSVWEGGAPIMDPGPLSSSRAGHLGYDPSTDATALGLAAGTPQAAWAPEAGTSEQMPFGTTLVAGADRYVRPVPGPITSAFGPRFHPILHYVRNHNGVDMTAACGVPVVAMADGKVARAGAAGGYGNLVEINHGTLDEDLVVSRYAHLSVIGVAAGDTVGRGQVVGLAGTTGLSTACHLHFEVLLNGSYVDPGGVLAGSLRRAHRDGPVDQAQPGSGRAAGLAAEDPDDPTRHTVAVAVGHPVGRAEPDARRLADAHRVAVR